MSSLVRQQTHGVERTKPETVLGITSSTTCSMTPPHLLSDFRRAQLLVGLVLFTVPTTPLCSSHGPLLVTGGEPHLSPTLSQSSAVLSSPCFQNMWNMSLVLTLSTSFNMQKPALSEHSLKAPSGCVWARVCCRAQLGSISDHIQFRIFFFST